MANGKGTEIGQGEQQVDEQADELTRGLQRLGQWIEVGVYVAGGFFLIAAAAYLLVDSMPSLWRSRSASAGALALLDHVLLVFVLVEVFHTVRFAIARHELRAEPFLVVALIACVRRILVVTAGTEPVVATSALVELGLLVVLLLASAAALLMLRLARRR